MDTFREQNNKNTHNCNTIPIIKSNLLLEKNAAGVTKRH